MLSRPAPGHRGAARRPPQRRAPSPPQQTWRRGVIAGHDHEPGPTVSRVTSHRTFPPPPRAAAAASNDDGRARCPPQGAAFFTSLADTFTMGDGGEGYGVGTIVGSAVFNILVIVALSCIPNESLKVDWYPIARDSSFYVVSILLLLCTITTGSATAENGRAVGLVEWWESMLYVLGYAAYIVFMKYSGDFRPTAVRWKDMVAGTNESGNFPENEKTAEAGCRQPPPQPMMG
eukprot:gene40968-9211_t